MLCWCYGCCCLAGVGQGEDWAHTPLHSGKHGSTNPPVQSRKWFFAKNPRNTAKHVALPFAQNNAPGGAEHIAGHCDLPRNLGEGSSASKAELCPRLSLLNSGATSSGGQQILPGSKSERPFLPERGAGPATASSQPPPVSDAYKSQRSSWKNLLQMILQNQSNTEKILFLVTFMWLRAPKVHFSANREMRGGGRHINTNENSCGLLSNLLALPLRSSCSMGSWLDLCPGWHW